MFPLATILDPLPPAVVILSGTVVLLLFPWQIVLKRKAGHESNPYCL